jgi:MFS family permease
MYGKLSDIIGRKPLLFFAIFMFLFGSAMCGAAQNFAWLAICKSAVPFIKFTDSKAFSGRGVQGLGGGGLIGLTNIIVSDIDESRSSEVQREEYRR